MSDFKTMKSGYSVEGNRNSYNCYGDPPIVTLHKLGSIERGFFTPAEARALASALNEAADKADGTTEAREKAKQEAIARDAQQPKASP